MAEGLSDLWVMQHNNVDGPPHRSLRIDFDDDTHIEMPLINGLSRSDVRIRMQAIITELHSLDEMMEKKASNNVHI